MVRLRDAREHVAAPQCVVREGIVSWRKLHESHEVLVGRKCRCQPVLNDSSKAQTSDSGEATST